jgi:hypothetical protein
MIILSTTYCSKHLGARGCTPVDNQAPLKRTNGRKRPAQTERAGLGQRVQLKLRDAVTMTAKHDLAQHRWRDVAPFKTQRLRGTAWVSWITMCVAAGAAGAFVFEGIRVGDQVLTVIGLGLGVFAAIFVSTTMRLYRHLNEYHDLAQWDHEVTGGA